MFPTTAEARDQSLPPQGRASHRKISQRLQELFFLGVYICCSEFEQEARNSGMHLVTKQGSWTEWPQNMEGQNWGLEELWNITIFALRWLWEAEQGFRPMVLISGLQPPSGGGWRVRSHWEQEGTWSAVWPDCSDASGDNSVWECLPSPRCIRPLGQPSEP